MIFQHGNFSSITETWRFFWRSIRNELLSNTVLLRVRTSKANIYFCLCLWIMAHFKETNCSAEGVSAFTVCLYSCLEKCIICVILRCRLKCVRGKEWQNIILQQSNLISCAALTQSQLSVCQHSRKTSPGFSLVGTSLEGTAISEKYFHYTRSIIFFIILRLVSANLDPYVSINYNKPRENRKWKDTYMAKTTWKPMVQYDRRITRMIYIWS